MKNFAIAIFLTLMLALLIEPMVDVANILREKILISSAVNNACRASKDRSLTYGDFRDLNAVIDHTVFVDQFADNFAESFDAVCTEKSSIFMKFRPTSTNFDDLTMDLTFTEAQDEDKTITTIHVMTKTRYKFKTKFLKQADASGLSGGPCIIKCDNTYVMTIRN